MSENTNDNLPEPMQWSANLTPFRWVAKRIYQHNDDGDKDMWTLHVEGRETIDLPHIYGNSHIIEGFVRALNGAMTQQRADFLWGLVHAGKERHSPLYNSEEIQWRHEPKKWRDEA